jgi:hypothetical protein
VADLSSHHSFLKSRFPESRKWSPLVRTPSYEGKFYEIEGMTHPVEFIDNIIGLKGFEEYLACLSEISLSDESTKIYAGLDLGSCLCFINY